MIYLQGSDRVVEIRESADSDLKKATARVSRAAALDGTVVISHSGFSHGDRTFTIRANQISKAVETDLWYLHENETTIRVATDEGVFYGAIQLLSTVNGKLSMTILVGGSDTD